MESPQSPPSVHQECETDANTARPEETADGVSSVELSVDGTANTLTTDNTQSVDTTAHTTLTIDNTQSVDTTAHTTLTIDNTQSIIGAGHTLTIDNSQDIFEMMYDAREKWRNIGGVFHLSQSTLNNINAENQNNDDKLRSVITEWLNKYGGTEECTWTLVAMALRNKTVAREDLAREVFEQRPQPWSVPPPSTHSPHTSPDSGSGATAVVTSSSSPHPQTGRLAFSLCELHCSNHILVCSAKYSECFCLSTGTVSMSSMPEMEKKILQRKVNTDTNNMIEQYALLKLQTLQYLHQIHCDVGELLVCIMDVQHVRRITKKSPLVQLEAQTSISGVFLELVKKSLISFLQFSILKRVITELCRGSQELQKDLKEYESEFNEYIKRRVCETRIYHEGRFEVFTGSKSQKKVELLIITDENWDDSIKFVKVVDLEALVAKCLNIDHFDLQIVSIEPHCLRIRYAVSIHIAETVFPLTSEEWKKLSNHGIIKIHCQKYFYTTDDKGMY